MLISPYQHSSSQPFSLFTHTTTTLFTSSSSSLHAHTQSPHILTKFSSPITAMHANRLGVAADHTGTIKLFTDTHILKQFTYHRARVNAVRLIEGRCVLSCSDDGTVVWNELESVRVLTGHNDYVRAVCLDECAVVSGALDGCILVHDLRESAPVARYAMDAPVLHLESSDGVVYVSTPTGISRFSVAQRAALRSTVNYGVNDLRVCNGLVYACTARALTVYDRNLEEVFFCRFKDESAGLACVNGEVLVGLKSGTVLGLRTQSVNKDFDENQSFNEMVYDATMSRSAQARTYDKTDGEINGEIDNDGKINGEVDNDGEVDGDNVCKKEMIIKKGMSKKDNVSRKDKISRKDNDIINNQMINRNKEIIKEQNVNSSLYYKENEHPVLILRKPFKTYNQYEQMLNSHEYRRCLTAVLTTNNDLVHRTLHHLHVHGVLKQAIFKRNVRQLCVYLCKHIGDVSLKSIALKALVIISTVFERMLVVDRRMLRRIRRAVRHEQYVQKECIRAYASIESVLEDVIEK